MSLLAAMDELEAKFTAWARRRKDLRAAIVVGSRARTDHQADEWSDLDIALVTTAAARYHADRSWITEIADVWAVAKDPSGVTYHVLFAGGMDAGIAIIPAAPVKLATRLLPSLRRIPVFRRRIESQLSEAAAYTSRGYRVLFDKDGITERFFSLIELPERAASPRPTREQFSWVVNEFWFTAVWTAKHLWRGELWHARNVGLEGRMKAALLMMMEWHACTTSPLLDTWEGGRFIEEWAGDEVISALQRSFAGYGLAESERALGEIMALFADIVADTALSLGYDGQPGIGRDVTAWIGQHRPAA